MEVTRLGSSDLDVSRVGLGCNDFGRRLDREAMRAAVAGSRLADRRLDEAELEAVEAVEALERVAAGRGRTSLELAIGGLASIPGVASVIAGATSPGQARANAAAGAWQAPPDVLV